MRWILLIIVFAGPLMADTSNDGAEARFRAVFEGFAKPPVAVTAGFVQGDSPAVVLARGVISADDPTPIRTDSPWHIGSITKGFTATMVQQQVAAGRYTLDTPLAELFPDFAAEMHPEWQAITLRAALSHTAGLRPNFTGKEMRAGFGADLMAARRALLRAHWSRVLPGTVGAYKYSNMGYVLVGHVVESHGGAPWEALVQRDIAVPLGLTSLGIGPPQGEGVPWGHRGLFGLKRAMDPTLRGSDNPAWMGPAGTIHLSMADLLAWGQAHLEACRGARPAFLSAQACQELHSPVSDTYGLGWETARLKLDATLLTVQGHSGSNTMWMAHLFYAPEADTVLVLAMNEGWVMRSQKMLIDLAKALLDPE